MTTQHRASIEEVRAMAAKHAAALREVLSGLMSPREATLDEYMSFYRGDDYSPRELRQIAAEFIDERTRRRQERERNETPPPDPMWVGNINLLMKLSAAAIGQDLPEDREELETTGWLYLQVLEAAAGKG